MALAGVMACARAVHGVQSWTGHAHGTRPCGRRVVFTWDTVALSEMW